MKLASENWKHTEKALFWARELMRSSTRGQVVLLGTGNRKKGVNLFVKPQSRAERNSAGRRRRVLVHNNQGNFTSTRTEAS